MKRRSRRKTRRRRRRSKIRKMRIKRRKRRYRTMRMRKRMSRRKYALHMCLYVSTNVWAGGIGVQRSQLGDNTWRPKALTVCRR